jgi:putrescine aminotransferase
MSLSLYTLNDVKKLSNEAVFHLHSKYLNAGLSAVLKAMDCDIIYKRAEDCIIEDTEGRKYIDFVGGYGALNMGHRNPHILKSLEQVNEAANLVFIGLNPYEGILAANLAVLTDHRLVRSFFCNSGSEAVESALKLARASTGRSKILYCENSYHGKTFGALAVTDRSYYRKPFEPLLPDCDKVIYGDAGELEERIKDESYAAFIVEPIQGEGGIIEPPAHYLTKVRALCSKYHTLLIADEVQTGMGRTGKLFAYQHDNIVPDILCLAKSLGGGMIPIGACLTTEEIYHRAYGDVSRCNLHSTTFGGNTYACAAAIAAFEVLFQDNLIEEAGNKGEYIKSGLTILQNKYPGIMKEVRGKGLMIGLEFEKKQNKPDIEGNIALQSYAAYVAKRLLNEFNVITAYSFNSPDVIRLEPPLSVTVEQMDQLLYGIESILRG